MKSWRAWALVALIFAAGAVVGASGMRLYMARHLPDLLRHQRQRLDEVFLDNIDREVGLSADQRARILPLLTDAVRRGEEIHASVRVQIDRIMSETDQRIAAEMNEGQRIKFKEFRERMAEMRRNGPPLPPPGPPPGHGRMPPGPPPGGQPGPQERP
jgi:hypothetical protein